MDCAYSLFFKGGGWLPDSWLGVWGKGGGGGGGGGGAGMGVGLEVGVEVPVWLPPIFNLKDVPQAEACKFLIKACYWYWMTAAWGVRALNPSS